MAGLARCILLCFSAVKMIKYEENGIICKFRQKEARIVLKLIQFAKGVPFKKGKTLKGKNTF